jgi:hypothetical protein
MQQMLFERRRAYRADALCFSETANQRRRQVC